MTTLTHCDGPGCTETKPEWPDLGDPPWHELESGKDFCSAKCLHRWSAPPVPNAPPIAYYEHMANGGHVDLDKLQAMADGSVPTLHPETP